MWSVFITVSYMLEKNVHSLVFGRRYSVSVSSNVLIVQFKSSEFSRCREPEFSVCTCLHCNAGAHCVFLAVILLILPMYRDVSVLGAYTLEFMSSF